MSGDEFYMAEALRLAERGRYSTHPNPRVGCLLVRDGEVVGRGYHQVAGQPHAEVLALREAGERARGATAYVTLEPCAHYGRTPPCAEALVAARVARVVAAMRDPNPLVAGRGFAILQRAGIEVRWPLLEREAGLINAGFVKRHTLGLPRVCCKLAMSLDGRTAMASGESQWITGEAARRDVQRLRAGHDAIMTGSGTLLADDPRLNVRLDDAELGDASPPVQPVAAVLDRHLRTSPHARIFDTERRVLLFHDAAIDPAGRDLGGAEAVAVPCRDGRLDLPEVLRRLARFGISDLLVEAGATLAGALASAGMLDELVVYVSPDLMGDQARGLCHLPGLSRMSQRLRFEFTQVRQVGRDLRVHLRPQSAVG